MFQANISDLVFLGWIQRKGGSIDLNKCGEYEFKDSIKRLKKRTLLMEKTGVYYLTVKGEKIAREWIKLDAEITHFNSLFWRIIK